MMLLALWENLPKTVDPSSSPPNLGYRGVSIVCGDDEGFLAYGGYVRRIVDNKVEWRIDQHNRFERLLISTAPNDLLPAEVREI